MLRVHLWHHDDHDHDHVDVDDDDDNGHMMITLKQEEKLTQSGVLDVLKVLVEGAGKSKEINEMHNKVS